jgi:Arc/MetJ family transcription regulator
VQPGYPTDVRHPSDLPRSESKQGADSPPQRSRPDPPTSHRAPQRRSRDGSSREVTNVYARCMTRTNIDLDDDLVAEVMRRFGVPTKKEAVDLALRRLVGAPLDRDFLLGLEGVGWDGDLDQLQYEKPDKLA